MAYRRRHSSLARIPFLSNISFRENCVDGVSTYDLDRIAEEETIKRNGTPTFKGYRGFPASLCTSLNHEVVHGIPSKQNVLKTGDIIGIDFGITYDGFVGDHAMIVPISDVRLDMTELMRVTRAVLYPVVAQTRVAYYLSALS